MGKRGYTGRPRCWTNSQGKNDMSSNYTPIVKTWRKTAIHKADNSTTTARSSLETKDELNETEQFIANVLI